MDLEKTLDSVHSRASTDRIIRWIGHSPSRFGELVSLLLKGGPRTKIRAAWPMSYCVEAHPELAAPHLRSLVRELRNDRAHDAIKRSIVRMLQYVSIPKPLQGEVATWCFDAVGNPRQPAAIRVFSLTTLERLAQQNPELQDELRLVLEDQLPYASAGFVNRASKVLKRLRARSAG